MRRLMTSSLAEHAGEQVGLAGWVHHQQHVAQVLVPLVTDTNVNGQVVDDESGARGDSAAAGDGCGCES